MTPRKNKWKWFFEIFQEEEHKWATRGFSSLARPCTILPPTLTSSVAAPNPIAVWTFFGGADLRLHLSCNSLILALPFPFQIPLVVFFSLFTLCWGSVSISFFLFSSLHESPTKQGFASSYLLPFSFHTILDLYLLPPETLPSSSFFLAFPSIFWAA